MDPMVKQFLLLNLGVLIGLVYFMMRRKPRKDSKTYVSSIKRTSNTTMVNDVRSNVEVQTDPSFKPYIVPDEDSPKQLNVIFTWNGHEWDAYEVLGIPAGSSMEIVVSAYDRALEKVDDKSKSFVQKAYQSICDQS